MELHHLRYFAAVARLGSFTRAAEECRVAQPSLSQQIRRLEELAGAPLFDRTSREVRLTDVGRVLLPRAEAILRSVEHAEAAVQETVGGRGGQLVVGTLPMTGSRVLPPVVAAFGEQHPGVQVRLREESTATLLDLAMRGETDITLTTLPLLHPELVAQDLLTEDILLAVPPGHPLAGQGAVPLASVAGEPFLLMKEGYGFRDLVLHACRRAGFEPQVAYESAHIDTIQAFVAVGLGVSLVPRMAAEPDRSPAPVFLNLIDPPLTRTLALVWHSDRFLSAAARAFLEVAGAVWRERSH